MCAERLNCRRPRFEGSIDERGYRARRSEADDVGYRSRRGCTAEGAVLEIGVSGRVPVVIMIMIMIMIMIVIVMRRHVARIRRTQFQQERRAARGHESQGNI
jgi:hypothetical protein